MPRAEVIALPVAVATATPVATPVPVVEVVLKPVSVMLQSPVSVREPRDDVRPLPVASTGAKVFHAPEFQVCRPHPWTEAINYLRMLFLELQQLLQQQGT